MINIYKVSKNIHFQISSVPSEGLGHLENLNQLNLAFNPIQEIQEFGD